MSHAAWEQARLNASRRPVVSENESELAMQEVASVDPPAAREMSHSASLTLTTHRLVWVAPSGSLAMALPLSKVSSFAESMGGLLKTHGKMRIETSAGRLELRFPAKVQFGSQLSSALAARRWAAPSPAAAPTPSASPSYASIPASPAFAGSVLSQQQQQLAQQQQQTLQPAAMVGIGGLERMQQQKRQAVDEALAVAFRDIDALQERAEEMVKIARGIQAAHARDAGEDAELNNMLQQAGIVVPVTKKSAGSMFYSELARQLSDFCVAVLRKQGPMIALPDLFCIFNRARGAEMISPDDLVRACELFEDLGMPVRLQRFPSGVLVVRPAALDEDATAAEIKKAVEENGPLTAIDLARIKHTPLPLAKEQLLIAERRLVLCRDETFEGVTFHLNFFPQAAGALQQRQLA